MDSKDACTYNNRGVLNQKMKKERAAEEDFNQALKLMPCHPIYLFNLADWHREAGKKDRAQQCLAEGVGEFSYSTQDVLRKKYGLSDPCITEVKEHVDNYNNLLEHIEEIEEIEESVQYKSNPENQSIVVSAGKLKEELKELMIKLLTFLESERERDSSKL